MMQGWGVPEGERVALYVHWPWCKRKCPYCDFNSHAITGKSAENEGFERYIGALLRELDGYGEGLKGLRVESVFVGGGTPSLMGGEGVTRLMDGLRDRLTLTPQTEVTVEINPTSASAPLFHALKGAGVTRVSVGVQGLQQRWLDFLGREHDVGQALATLENALGIIGNVNADLIYGLPDQPLTEWVQQLTRFTGMGLPHLSCYQLTVEANTAFYGQVRRGEWTPMEGDGQADFFDTTRSILTGAGYENYEISNFARPGYACRHNVHVWHYRPYLGIGAGAHGRWRISAEKPLATEVSKHPFTYLERIERESGAFVRKDEVPPELAIQEALMLGLRLATGFDAQKQRVQYGEKAWISAVNQDVLDDLINHGLLWQKHGLLGLTPRGWPLLDSIAQRILTRLA